MKVKPIALVIETFGAYTSRFAIDIFYNMYTICNLIACMHDLMPLLKVMNVASPPTPT